MRKLFAEGSWPTPEEWEQLLSPSGIIELEEDAAMIIAEGLQHDCGWSTKPRKEKRNASRIQHES